MRTASAVVVILAVGLVAATPAHPDPSTDSPPILPLSQVRSGMTGYGLTVVHGTTIQRFDVKILGVLHGGPASDLILFRASGPLIRESGGTASGMSGSPIYVGGRLAGALSYGYHFAGPDADLSLATPIEEMLKVLERPAALASWAPRVYRADGILDTPAGPLRQVLVLGSVAEAAAYNARAVPGTRAVAPVEVPLLTSGMTPAALGLLGRTLGRYHIVPRQIYGGRGTFPTPPVQPGSSLGVELVRGDVEVGAIGTVTYRRGNEILAFGHPLLNAGSAPMLLTSAWIDTVVRSVDFPFKEGSFGALLGTLTQDRGVGIAGRLGRLPALFGVRVWVRDLDHGTTRSLGAQVVRRPDLAEDLVPTTVLSLVQRALDRVAGGSATVRIALRARHLPREVVREDRTYDVADIATTSVLDVPQATQLLFGNFFRDLDPIDMSVDIAVTARPNTALLVEARPSARTVRPGEALTVRVRLQPYGGGPPLSRTVEVPVPQDFPVGPAFLLVGTAGALNDSTPPDQKFQQLVALERSPIGTGSLDEAIDQFENAGKNTEVMVELVPEAVLVAAGSNANPGFEAPAGTSFETPWVVLGRFQIPMTVK